MDSAVKMLYSAFHTTKSNAHWRFGTLTADMAFAVNNATTREEFFAEATVVKCFTAFFIGGDSTMNGKYDIGRTLRSLQDADARNLLFKRLIEADQLEQLHDALVAIIKALRRQWSATRKPWLVPDWQTLSDEIHLWLDGDTRDEVLMRWTLSFRTFPKRGTGSVADHTDTDDEKPLQHTTVSDTLF